MKMNFLISFLFLLTLNFGNLQVNPKIIMQKNINQIVALNHKPPSTKDGGMCIKWINQSEMYIPDGHGDLIHRPAQSVCYLYEKQRHR